MTVINRIAVKLTLLLLLLPLLCCGQSSPVASEAALKQEFDLKLGQTVHLKGEKLSIKFASVLEDSRCPKGEQCIRQGEGKISLELIADDKKPVTVELSTAPVSQESTHLEYTVKLVALNPYPVTNRRVSPDDYRATLVVDKNRAGGNQVNTNTQVKVSSYSSMWFKNNSVALIRIR